MKKVYLLLATIATVQFGYAQQELKQAVIKVKMETQMEGGEGMGGGMVMRGPGESTIVFTVKDSMTKLYNETEIMLTTNITNTASGKVIQLTETNGEKKGYYTMPADREDQKRRMDSIQKENANNGQSGGGGMVFRTSIGGSNVKEIIYNTGSEAKEIAGITCKKATAVMVNAEGVEEKIELWYTPDYVLPKGANLGGRGGLNFKDLKGIPMEYSTVRKLSFGGNEMSMIMTFTVTELKTNATVEDKEFNVPKGYKVKPYAEWIKDNPDGMPQIRTMFRAG